MHFVQIHYELIRKKHCKFHVLVVLFVFIFSHLLFLHWLSLYRLLQSDTTIIPQIFITIYTDKLNIYFNGVRWLDAFNLFSIELSTTDLQWSNYLKYSELSYKLDRNAQCFHLSCILRCSSLWIVFTSFTSSKPVTKPEYVHRFVLDVSTWKAVIFRMGIYFIFLNTFLRLFQLMS